MAEWQTCTRNRACSPISGTSGYGRVAVASDSVPATWRLWSLSGYDPGRKRQLDVAFRSSSAQQPEPLSDDRLTLRTPPASRFTRRIGLLVYKLGVAFQPSNCGSFSGWTGFIRGERYGER